MRKILKEQAQEVTRLLNRAHDEIRSGLRAGRKDDILYLLEQCQDAAIHLGETIENEEGIGFVTVTLLEEYCEAVYQIYEKFLRNQHFDANIAYKILRKNLILIENSIKNDIKVHLEILFLPYKAAMWDSLESIWTAANADPGCRAYVVPIPYYDKLPDGTLGQMHDEKNLYPENVPVMDWREYDIETRHPDAIFIHSPYDSGNLVTTVHPYFYSGRLKGNTDLLVYVPYFIALGDLPDGFCVTPGSLNADWIIVQSERIRQNYLDAFQRFEKEEKCEGIYGNAEKKLIVSGSPKFDKVTHSVRGDFHLPDPWKHLIEAGGVSKKVIFYNTSLGAMLKWNGQYLHKLRSVLGIFRSRDDVVLWWRPHPLGEAAIHSMRPTLLREYKQIITEYRKEGWGIYDDTSDLHRAIAWSDAYYGDESSVAVLFQAIGKPVMLQETEDLPLVFENFIQVDNDCWFTGFNLNGLFRLNSDTWKTDFMGCFPAEEDSARLFFSITRYENLLIFAPFSAEQISLYRMDTSEFISIPIREPEKLPESKGILCPKENDTSDVPYYEYRKFSVCAAYKGYAFLFPCTYPAVVKINLGTYETEYLCEPIAELRKLIKHPQSCYFRKGVQSENAVKLWYVAANAFVEFNMDTCQFKICGFVNDGSPYVEAVCDRSGYWMFPLAPDKTIQKLSADFQQSVSIDLSEGGISEYQPYLHAVDTGDMIYAFPATARHVVRIIKKENRAEAFPVLDSENVLTHPGPPTDWQFFIAERAGSTVFAFDAFSHKLVSYNTATGDVKKEEVKMGPEIYADADSFVKVWEMYYGRITQGQELAVREERRRNLPAFLELLTKRNEAFLECLRKAQRRIAEKGEFQTTENCGRSIYENTRKYLLGERREDV